MVSVASSLLTLIVAFGCLTALADAPDFSSVAEYESTSDDFFRTSLNFSYRNHRRDHLYPFRAEDKEGTDWGLGIKYTRGQTRTENFSGQRFHILAGHKYSEKYRVDARVGVHMLQPSVSEARTIGHGGIYFGFFPWTSFGGSLRLVRDLAYHEMVLPGGVLEGLSATALELRGLGLLGERWRLPFLISSKSFSDANQRSEFDMGLMYGISPGVPWIWLGLGVNHLRNSKTVLTYWTPSVFSSGGPRLDLSVPLGAAWSCGAAVNLNRFYDQDSQSWGSGHYADFSLRYGDRNQTNISLDYISINALRSSGIWVSSGMSLNFSTAL